MNEEHGYGPYTDGCRCAVCRKAKADYTRERRRKARVLAQKFSDENGRHYVPGITHGRFGYEERGCRCDACLAARAKSDAQTYRQKKVSAEEYEQIRDAA